MPNDAAREAGAAVKAAKRKPPREIARVQWHYLKRSPQKSTTRTARVSLLPELRRPVSPLSEQHHEG